MLHQHFVTVVAAVTVALAAGCTKTEKYTVAPPPEAPESTRAAKADTNQTTPAPKRPWMRDSEVTNAVKLELSFDAVVPTKQLKISTISGVVTLAGTVPNLLAKKRAIRITETVKGVRSIDDQLHVEPIKRSDASIASDVLLALQLDPGARALKLHVTVASGEVKLAGTVHSWQQKAHAARIAEGITGVRAVDNKIKVQYVAMRSDDAIRTDVLQALRWDSLIDDFLLNVRVHDGIVIVSGIAGTLAERSRIARKAWVAGVKDVSTTAVKIRTWANDPDVRTHGFTPKSDDDIASALQVAMKLDPRVHSYNLSTDVSDGRVTLRGTVKSADAKQAAEMIARDTVGVVEVENQIIVATGISDKKVAHAIRGALLRNPITGGLDIRVGVDGGVAHLQGKVNSFAEKAEAANVARTVLGVVRVNNDLAVADTTPYLYNPYVYPYEPYVPWTTYTYKTVSKTDQELRTAIIEQLEWNPFVDADQVNVKVAGGVVTLSGNVHTWRERTEATRSALKAGAVTVRNSLHVK